jgi:hypothetical protein
VLKKDLSCPVFFKKNTLPVPDLEKMDLAHSVSMTSQDGVPKSITKIYYSVRLEKELIKPGLASWRKFRKGG